MKSLQDKIKEIYINLSAVKQSLQHIRNSNIKFRDLAVKNIDIIDDIVEDFEVIENGLPNT